MCPALGYRAANRYQTFTCSTKHRTTDPWLFRVGTMGVPIPPGYAGRGPRGHKRRAHPTGLTLIFNGGFPPALGRPGGSAPAEVGAGSSFIPTRRPRVVRAHAPGTHRFCQPSPDTADTIRPLTAHAVSLRVGTKDVPTLPAWSPMATRAVPSTSSNGWMRCPPMLT